PRVGANEEARQIRHDDEKEKEPASPPPDAREDVGGRIPEDQAASRDGEAHAEGAREDPQVGRLREEVGIVGQAPPRRLDAHEEEPEQREGVEDEQEGHGGKDEQPYGAALPSGDRFSQDAQRRASSRTRNV